MEAVADGVSPTGSARFGCAALGSFLIHLTLGTFYCWGNITPYVTSYMQWKGQPVDYTDTSLVFACGGFCMGAVMALGGLLQARIGTRSTALVGCWTHSLSVCMSWHTVQVGLPALISSYSVLFGVGIGLAYTAPIQCMMRWLPERKGLATGLVVVGFGLGASVFDPLQAALVNPRNLEPTIQGTEGAYYDWTDPELQQHVLENVPGMFPRLAAIYALLQLAGVALLFDPPSPASGGAAVVGYSTMPLLHDAPLVSAADRSVPGEKPRPMARDLGAGEMLQTREYWLLAANFFCNAQAIFFGASFCKSLAARILPQGAGASDALLTGAAALAGLFNAGGRLFWGSLGDGHGFRSAMLALCLLQAAFLATLPLCPAALPYAAWLCGVMFCVGGNFSLFPAASAAYFGERHLASNYGLLFLAQSCSMLLAPEIAGTVLQETASAAALCWVVAAFVSLGGAAAWLMRAPDDCGR